MEVIYRHCDIRHAGALIMRRILRRALPWITLVLAGCAAGPDHVKPSIDAPPAWRIDYAQAADVANTRWWLQFGDPVLTSLIESARKENRDLVVAAARVDAFLGTPVSTRSQFYPQASYSLDAARNRMSAVGASPLPGGGGRPVPQPLQRRARGLLADRSVRTRAATDRGCAGSGLRNRAGTARRRAVGRGQYGDELHRTADARPPARDRAGYRG